MSIRHKNPAVIEAEAKGELGYDKMHDAYYNTKTGEWLEEGCEGDNCPFCSDRPEKYEV